MTKQRTTKGTRGYSRAFPVKTARRRYLLDDIPADLWIRARAKASRDGVSMRGLILQQLTDYIETGEKQ